MLSFLEKCISHTYLIVICTCTVSLLELLTLTLLNSGAVLYKSGLSDSRWNKGTFSMSVKVSRAKFETCNLREGLKR